MLSQATIRHGTGPDGDSISPPDNVVCDGISDDMGGVRYPPHARERNHPPRRRENENGAPLERRFRWDEGHAGSGLLRAGPWAVPASGKPWDNRIGRAPRHGTSRPGAAAGNSHAVRPAAESGSSRRASGEGLL